MVAGRRSNESVMDGILETIGRTPLVRLSRIAPKSGAEILAKVESFNPGGSVKDRIGLAMIREAESRGALRPGATIVEATAGNTGIGLAIAATYNGYRIVFVVPDKMSKEKISLLKAFGAEVVVTQTAVPPTHPDYYTNKAKSIAAGIPGSFVPDQFSNPANPDAHYRTTGPEIWVQSGGKIDYFVAGMGTGGTISGVAKALKERDARIRIVGVDPEGSVYAEYKSSGVMGKAEPYMVEGIGEEFIPQNMDMSLIDCVVTVSDRDAFRMARELARREGILAGGSAGAAVYAAVQIAERKEAAGKRIVVLLPDTGRNYLSKIFDDEWMKAKGFI